MAKIESRACSCIICHKETSQLGIVTHFSRSHGDASAWVNSIETKRKTKFNTITKYNESPNTCIRCGSILTYDKRNNTFCSSSCSAKYSNNDRAKSGWFHTEESKLKISSSVNEYNRKLKRFKPKQEIVGHFSKLVFCTCKFCDAKFTSKSNVRVCNDCQHLKYKNGYDNWSFKFNVYNYPDLFDLQKLNDLGWCSFGGKRGGKQNLNGLSRDHKVSVHEAKLNSYDPYYITHPCNCELLSMRENSKKNAKSSITYDELVELVNVYDASRGVH